MKGMFSRRWGVAVSYSLGKTKMEIISLKEDLIRVDNRIICPNIIEKLC
jgi:hypothetical protein